LIFNRYASLIPFSTDIFSPCIAVLGTGIPKGKIKDSIPGE
jgi:hypothetical protein